MMGDYHVRFRERLGVKFPLPTRHVIYLMILVAKRGIDICMLYKPEELKYE